MRYQPISWISWVWIPAERPAGRVLLTKMGSKSGLRPSCGHHYEYRGIHCRVHLHVGSLCANCQGAVHLSRLLLLLLQWLKCHLDKAMYWGCCTGSEWWSELMHREILDSASLLNPIDITAQLTVRKRDETIWACSPRCYPHIGNGNITVAM